MNELRKMKLNFNKDDTLISWKEGKYLANKFYKGLRQDLEDENLSENLEDIFDWIETIQEIQNDYHMNIGVLNNFSAFSDSFEAFLKSLEG